MYRSLVAALLLLTVGCGDDGTGPGDPGDPGNSRENPALAGETIEVTTSGVFSNDATVRLTLLSTIRGDAALDTVLAANQFNDVPAPGWEYLLTRFRVEVVSQPPGSDAYRAAWLDWEVVRSDGFIYARGIGSSACCLEAALDREGLPGASWEGWESFFVEQSATGLLVVYERGASGEVWFRLP